jgi:hypothetical protein
VLARCGLLTLVPDHETREITPAGFLSSVAALTRAQHVPDDRQRSDQQHTKDDPAADPVVCTENLI